MKLPSAALLSLLMTSAAFAAEEGEANLFAGTMAQSIAAIIVFIILFFLLQRFAWGPILQGLQDREKKIKDELESAEQTRSQAQAALEEYEQELAKARGEATAMIQQARADAQRVADELRSKNEAELTSLKNRARDEIESAKRTALGEIYSEASLLATSIAGRILDREINADDHARLVEDSLKELQSIKGNGN